MIANLCAYNFVTLRAILGKTTAAISLAKRHEAALISVNAVVMEAISNGNTPAGRRARQLCSDAAHRLAEEQRALEGEGEVIEKKVTTGGLSVEAVAAHTQGTGT
jgi:hydrocephalus-inducing protein